MVIVSRLLLIINLLIKIYYRQYYLIITGARSKDVGRAKKCETVRL